MGFNLWTPLGITQWVGFTPEGSKKYKFSFKMRKKNVYTVLDLLKNTLGFGEEGYAIPGIFQPVDHPLQGGRV